MPGHVLSRQSAAKFRDALKTQKPELFATISAAAWRREWVLFCKHYGCGNDAVLNYLSRYVFRTAISNARILDMDDTHVPSLPSEPGVRISRTRLSSRWFYLRED